MLESSSLLPAHEEAVFWQTTAFGSTFDLLHARYITHTFAKHTHDGFVIAEVEAGAEGFSYRGEYVKADAGTVVILNPAEVHTGEAVIPEGWHYRVIYPGAELMAKVAAQINPRFQGMPFFKQAAYRDPVLWAMVRQTHLVLEHSDSPLERETHLLSLLTLVISRYADVPASPTRIPPAHSAIERARDYLHAHYAEPLSLDQVARLVHLSPYHFSHLFSAQIGVPPHVYLNQIRVRHARNLLCGGADLADTALATGFADQSHLNRNFKRIVGVTPGQFRRFFQQHPMS